MTLHTLDLYVDFVGKCSAVVGWRCAHGIPDSNTGSVAMADKSSLMASYLNLFSLPTAKVFKT
jgi:hypothetical protein